jgi:hypothetical protein
MARFDDKDPGNLRGLAEWITGLPTRTDADRVLIADMRDDLRRIADVIEDGPPTELPAWRVV